MPSFDDASTNQSIIMANNGELTKHEEEKENWSKLPVDHPRKLIPELCRLFYQLGWVTGSKKHFMSNKSI